MRQPAGIAEEEIISHCKKGSLKYQELLYKQFYGYAMGIGLRYCSTRDDALEVVNDSFIKVFNSIQNFNHDKPFKAWLRTIIINTSIDRRRKNLKLLLNVDLEDAVSVGNNAVAIENLNAQDLLKLMNELPVLHLTVFNLYEIDGYSHEEIAVLLAIPASSSRVYLSRAKERLRTLLRNEEQSYGRRI